MESNKKKYKKAPVVIPEITPTEFTLKLRRENERLINQLERLEHGPLRIKKWFNKRC